MKKLVLIALCLTPLNLFAAPTQWQIGARLFTPVSSGSPGIVPNAGGAACHAVTTAASSNAVTYTMPASSTGILIIGIKTTTDTVSSISGGGTWTYQNAENDSTDVRTEMWATGVGASASATTITVNLSGSSKSVACVLDYANVGGFGLTTLNDGTSATQTITSSLSAANNYIVAGIGSYEGGTYTTSVGTIRQSASTGTTTADVSAVLGDNTSASTGSLAFTVTHSASHQYAALAMELRVSGATVPCGPISLPAGGHCYYLATTGSDSNAGTTSGSPWLTPNHALNCGDAIDAASGTYTIGNFTGGEWGTVTCPAANNVAWLVCATFDTCKWTSTTTGMAVSSSFWGIQGWEGTQTSNSADDACFGAADNSSGIINHIIFANDIANGCYDGAFSSYNTSSTVSFDYVIYAGDIAYDGAQGSTDCLQGFNFQQPIASDTTSGTHLYVGWNYAWANVDPDPCQGGTPSDGSGMYAGALDGTGSGSAVYEQQIVYQGNIAVGNGAPGFEVWQNEVGGTNAAVYFLYNTAWDNTTDTSLQSGTYGEFAPEAANDFTIEYNIAATNQSTATGNSYYAIYVESNGTSSTVDYNWLYSSAGHNTGSNNSFVFGSHNLSGTSPGFTSPSVPGAPSCSSYASVPACMAGMISTFTPTASGSSGYGRQAPSSTPVHDTLFPAWLCTYVLGDLPAGVIENGCG